MSLIESILHFPNPNTPDLGCLVRRKHGFEIDPDVDFEDVHVDFNPSVDFGPAYHQTYFRVACGHAKYFQRCLVYMTSDATLPPPVLEESPPAFVLGGDYPPRPSEWSRFPTMSGARFYWFFGQHLDPATGTWKADALVGHAYDIFENGTVSIVRYDDTGADRDFNDLVVEVAIVGRRSWTDVFQAENQVAVNGAIEQHGLPRLRALLERGGTDRFPKDQTTSLRRENMIGTSIHDLLVAYQMQVMPLLRASNGDMATLIGHALTELQDRGLLSTEDRKRLESCYAEALDALAEKKGLEEALSTLTKMHSKLLADPKSSELARALADQCRSAVLDAQTEHEKPKFRPHAQATGVVQGGPANALLWGAVGAAVGASIGGPAGGLIGGAVGAAVGLCAGQSGGTVVTVTNNGSGGLGGGSPA